MTYSLQVQSEAVIDMQEAFEWYEMQKEGLGFGFIEEVENGFENVCKHPQYYTSVNADFRRIKVKRFPYLIIYEIREDSVIVVSVMHTSRNTNL